MNEITLRKLKKQLEIHEGKRKFPYVDTVGKTTIGIGRNLTDVGVSETTIQQMLDEDVTKTLDFLQGKSWFTELDDVRQQAVANMTFNLMGKVLDFKKMIAALVAKDWDRAANELLDSTFAYQTGQRAKDLAQMIRTGQ